MKKIAINPSQFYFPINLNNNEYNFKEILKGYLIVVFLHEIKHFLRLFNDENYYIDIPRGKEGGKLFIKYLFGIEIINRINYDEVHILMSIESWKDSEKIKNLFINQKETNTVINTKDNIYPKSISFYSTHSEAKIEKNRNNKFIKY